MVGASDTGEVNGTDNSVVDEIEGDEERVSEVIKVLESFRRLSLYYLATLERAYSNLSGLFLHNKAAQEMIDVSISLQVQLLPTSDVCRSKLPPE